MRDKMRIGDRVLFYHSNAKPPGVAGIPEVCRESYPDFTQFDPSSKYFDPKATPDNPHWFMVDVRFVEKFEREVGLPEIRATPELAKMVLVNRSRLSVQPVTEAEYEAHSRNGRGIVTNLAVADRTRRNLTAQASERRSRTFGRWASATRLAAGKSRSGSAPPQSRSSTTAGA